MQTILLLPSQAGIFGRSSLPSRETTKRTRTRMRLQPPVVPGTPLSDYGIDRMLGWIRALWHGCRWSDLENEYPTLQLENMGQLSNALNLASEENRQAQLPDLYEEVNALFEQFALRRGLNAKWRGGKSLLPRNHAITILKIYST